VVRDFEEKGVCILYPENEWETVEKGTIVIRSHGVTRAEQEKMQAYGFDVGVMLRFGYRFYGQIEANYNFVSSLNSIGQMVEDNWNGVPTQQYLTQQSINIPVMAGVKLFENKNFNLRLMVGPTFNFNIGQNGAIQAEGVDSELKTCSFGLDCGLGVDIWVFALDLRYRLVQPGYAYKVDEMVLNTNPLNSFEISLGWKIFDKTK
jgi:hypothetical protein